MIKFKELIESINEAAKLANQTVADIEGKIIKDFFVYDEESDKYTARTITIDYPSKDVNGKDEKTDIQVPLITLVPVTPSTIDELRFTTSLDIALNNDELMVSFSPKIESQKEILSGKNKTKTTAELELIIKPHQPSEGLTKLIEGYEKTLRQQIPN